MLIIQVTVSAFKKTIKYNDRCGHKNEGCVIEPYAYYYRQEVYPLVPLFRELWQKKKLKKARFSIAFSCLTSRPLMNIASGNNGKPSNADEWKGSIPQGVEFHQDKLLTSKLKSRKYQEGNLRKCLLRKSEQPSDSKKKCHPQLSQAQFT